MVTNTSFNSLIITYNSADEISDLLGDLQKFAPSHRVIVVDNASQDSTVEIVKNQFPEVIIIVNSRNLGFSKAVNQGVDLCETEFVFLLNPDIRIQNSNFHLAMLDCLQQGTTIACVGPLQFMQRGRAYKLNLTWSYWTPRAFMIYLSYALQLKHTFSEPVPTTFLNAGCLLLRKTAFIHVGKLNEKYFLYGEEPDLFLKFKRYHYKCKLHPGVNVVHYRERSIRKLPFGERWLRRSQALANIVDALIRGLFRL
jgi:GT2 family glycosyltransferase